MQSGRPGGGTEEGWWLPLLSQPTCLGLGATKRVITTSNSNSTTTAYARAAVEEERKPRPRRTACPQRSPENDPPPLVQSTEPRNDSNNTFAVVLSLLLDSFTGLQQESAPIRERVRTDTRHYCIL